MARLRDRFGGMWRVTLVMFALMGCKTTASSPAAEPPASSAVASDDDREVTGPSERLRAEGTIPEPEVGPCKNCSVDIARRVQGSFQDVPKCGASGEPVVYPISAPRIVVLAGDQQGDTFDLDGAPATYEVGAPLEGELPPEAKPEGWVEAQIVVTDSAERTCSSTLKILQ